MDQRDPLNQIANAMRPADANPYAYAACNGVNATDPMGLQFDLCSRTGEIAFNVAAWAIVSTVIIGLAIVAGPAAVLTAGFAIFGAGLSLQALWAGQILDYACDERDKWGPPNDQ